MYAKFAITAIWMLIFAACSLAQTDNSSPCPVIEVSGPSGLVAPGKRATYTVRVMKADQPSAEYDDSGLEYIWSSSAGKIISGQGTRTISIEQPQSALTATVEVKGLPANCSNIVSEYSGGDPMPQAVLISEFWTTTTTDEAELEKLAAELRKDPSVVGYIFIGTTGNEGKEIYERKRDELTSWIERSEIPPEMFTLVDLPDTENITRIWIVPPGADLPIPQRSK